MPSRKTPFRKKPRQSPPTTFKTFETYLTLAIGAAVGTAIREAIQEWTSMEETWLPGEKRHRHLTLNLVRPNTPKRPRRRRKADVRPR